VRDSEPERSTVAVEFTDPSSARSIQGSLLLVRVLREGSSAGTDALGSVEADWTRLDGTTARGTVAVVR
jgi:hypothetical protein